MKPYFGQDIRDLEDACSKSLREHFQQEPTEDLHAFNPNVKMYGRVWAEIVERVDGLYVVAGLTGNLSGVPIALFEYQHREHAKRYAADFESGGAFAIVNGSRWLQYVEQAHNVRKIDATLYGFLKSRGRTEGIAADGKVVNCQSLLRQYICTDNEPTP